MGISVSLLLNKESISHADWFRVYEETLEVARGWPVPLLGIGFRNVAGEQVVAYKRAYEVAKGDEEHQRMGGCSGRFWRIVGDGQSRLTFEGVDFPSEYGVANVTSCKRDVLLEAVSDGGCSRLFGDKTQGRPYHQFIVAIATLVENRFEGAAFVKGDLDAKGSVSACKCLEDILGEPFQPPVVLDKKRLYARLRRGLGEEEAQAAIDDLTPFVSNQLIADLAAIISRRESVRLRDEVEHAPGCTDINQLGEMTRKAICLFVDALHAMERRAELVHRIASHSVDNTFWLRLIAKGTDHQNMHLTDFAWDDIERLDSEGLQFLATLASADCGSLDTREMARAVYESVAVRNFALEQWRRKALA